MKQLKTLNYEAPTLVAIECNVEAGFSISETLGYDLPDFMEDNIL